MKWTFYNNLSDCNPSHLYEILRLRQDIFIIEQDCIYNDIDGLDTVSSHLLLFDDKEVLMGYLRIVPAGRKFNDISLGRIAIRKPFRGRGFGKELIKKGLQTAFKSETKAVRIEAQAHLETYYEDLGFYTRSELYDVDGIPHVQMVLQRDNQSGY